MYLKELNLFGFKSFPEKTSLQFNSGITAVVGPNGCGKSNVFDAIKWALGEQSPKSLRGSKMEDIIFSGTENYSALNYAEVGLVFLNDDNYLPINYSEVLISRRLYRSGESQYFINKSPVRLKDVQNLFLGTGIGESTYSFVEQGKIEALLSYKPEDKRLIFDEASGIVKYKERKKETFRRLSEAEDNIVRLDDILAEVKRQINYLERQAQKAQKYKEVKNILIETEKGIAFLSKNEIEEKAFETGQKLDLLKKQEKETQELIGSAASGLEKINQEQACFRQELEESNTLIISAEAEIKNYQNNIEFSQERIKELGERSRQLEATLENLKEKIATQLKKESQEKARFLEIEEGCQKFEQKLQYLAGQRDDSGQKLKQAQKNLKQQKESVLIFENEKAKAHNSIVELQAQIATLFSRKKRLVLDKGKLDNLLSENQDKFQTAQAHCQQVSAKLNSLIEKKQELLLKEKELEQKNRELSKFLTEQEKIFFELQASFNFLKDFKTKYEVFSRKENVTVIFDQDPGNINKLVASLKDREFVRQGEAFTAKVEAKVIAFDENQLGKKIEAAEAKINQAKQQLESVQKEREALLDKLSSESSHIEQYQNDFNQARQEKDTAERELRRLEEENGLVGEETKNTLSEIESLEAKKEEAENNLHQVASRLSQANQLLLQEQNTIDECEEGLRVADIQTAQVTAQREALLKEKESIASKVDFFREETESSKKSIQEFQEEKDSGEKQISALNQKIINLQQEITSTTSNIKQALERKKELLEKESSLNRQSQAQRQQYNQLEEAMAKLKQEVYGQKLKIQGFEYEKEKIKDYLKQVYGLNIELDELKQGQKNKDELLGDKQRYQKKLDSLGEVNLIAIEEFEELRQRRDFLESQKLDLVTSKENLKKAISKINRTSRQVFLETFEKIEIEFKKNYKFLFNGGRARLILLDPDDVLDSGVEIEVQPPGKKLQNVSLLSGGEKALTAIALIFSIFTVKPSPLCVLDEIDAPLDEANVDRFNHILKEFARNAQFILITHNKKTMSNADVLYGVTMQQKGVSKLVSVKFAQN